jgi:hypothetical protein
LLLIGLNKRARRVRILNAHPVFKNIPQIWRYVLNLHKIRKVIPDLDIKVVALKSINCRIVRSRWMAIAIRPSYDSDVPKSHCFAYWDRKCEAIIEGHCRFLCSSLKRVTVDQRNKEMVSRPQHSKKSPLPNSC